MSSWQEYAEEKRVIDELVSGGFAPAEVTETLDGDAVRFVKAEGGGAREAREILLRHPESRKYLGAVLLGRLREAARPDVRESDRADTHRQTKQAPA